MRYRAEVLGLEMPKLKPGKKQKPKDKTPSKLRKGVTCALHCGKYPCFPGINTMASNLAETCHKFIER